MKFKASQSDFEALREALQQKADKGQTKKDIDRLDSLLEELRQNMSSFADKNSALSKEVDRLAQFVEMLSKSMNSLRNQPTPQPTQSNGMDESVIKDILSRLEALENAIRNVDSQMQGLREGLEVTLNQKADLDSLKALDDSFQVKLNEVAR